MKTILKYLKEFIAEDFNVRLYLYAFIFTAILLTLNFSYDLKDRLDLLKGNPSVFIYYFLFYAFPYYAIAIPQHYWVHGNKRKLTVRFWHQSLFFVGVISVVSAFYFHKDWFTDLLEGHDLRYLNRLIFYLRPFFIALPLYIIYKRYFYSKHNIFYGWQFKGQNLNPYFVMIAIMLPLIIIASYQPDFLRTYPKYKFWNYYQVSLPMWLHTLIFEIIYGLNFAMTEMMFRGTLVVAMITIVGRNAILPMAVLYCVLHFGKPLGEAISSFFGGYILGVIAYKTKSITGGFIVHVGIAYCMEIAAISQYYLNIKN